MAGLRKYVEWMSRGRRTDRVAYVLKEWDLPDPLPGAEWQQDVKFNPAEEVRGRPHRPKAIWRPDLRNCQA